MADRKNICVVCSGNICRSPFVEGILKRELPEEHIFSTGLLGIEKSPAYQVCVELAPLYHIDISSHRSQGTSRKKLIKCDYILAMTRQHIEGISLFETDAVTQLLSEYLSPGKKYDMGIFGEIEKGDDISDPMGQPADVVKPVLDVMEIAAVAFARHLKEKQE